MCDELVLDSQVGEMGVAARVLHSFWSCLFLSIAVF